MLHRHYKSEIEPATNNVLCNDNYPSLHHHNKSVVSTVCQWIKTSILCYHKWWCNITTKTINGKHGRKFIELLAYIIDVMLCIILLTKLCNIFSAAGLVWQAVLWIILTWSFPDMWYVWNPKLAVQSKSWGTHISFHPHNFNTIVLYGVQITPIGPRSTSSVSCASIVSPPVCLLPCLPNISAKEID